MRGWLCDNGCGLELQRGLPGATLTVSVLVDDEGKPLPSVEATFCPDCAIELAREFNLVGGTIEGGDDA